MFELKDIELPVNPIKECKVAVYTRANLFHSCKDTPIEQIAFIHFKDSALNVQHSSIVLFIENDGRTKLVKNRWGNSGVVVNDSTIKTLNELKEKI